MSSETKNISALTKPSFITIEVDDLMGYFISYWNLAIKKFLSEYYCAFNLEYYPTVKVPLDSFNINVMANSSIGENEKQLLFEEKLFTMKIHYLASEKDLNSDFFQEVKQAYDKKNLNLVLITINDIKEGTNVIKDCTKIINKIKSKTGLNDIGFLPYNIIDFDKLQPSFPPFLDYFSERFSNEFKQKFEKMTKKFETYGNLRKKGNEKEFENYKYLEELIYYFDLLTYVNYWDVIQRYCKTYLFKELSFLKSKYTLIKSETIGNCYDINKFKLIYKSKKLTNVEFQEYLLYFYIKSFQQLEKYTNIYNFINLIPFKMNSFIKHFKTEYHYIFWLLNYFYYLVEYFKALQKTKSLSYIDFKIVKQILINSYSLCIKLLNQYAVKSKNIYIPNNNILTELIKCIENNKISNIQEQMTNLINNKKVENNNDLTLFINDIKDNKDKISMIFNDNNKYLEEFLSLLNDINKSNKECYNLQISIKCIFQIAYILIFFCKFKEVKEMLVPLLHYKLLKETKIKYLYEYICFILLLALSFIEKNYDNLNLVFKLLNIKYMNTNKLLKSINCEDKNMIHKIISKYLESCNLNEIQIKDDKNKEICFSLDDAFDIKFFNGENKTLFINKLKNELQKIEYKITNNTGIELNVNKIYLILEENEKDSDNTPNNDNKKKIEYLLDNNKNRIKKIESFVKDKNDFFEIEYKDIFKTNNLYKLVEVQYEMNNSIKCIYHIKQKIDLLFSELNINIKAEMLPSYGNPSPNPSPSPSPDDIAPKQIFYYNVLSMIKINLLNIKDISELKNKTIIIQITDDGKSSDSILKIQSELLKSALKQKIPEIKINDLSIEFPPNSIKNIKDIENLEIPFFYENLNYYTQKKNKIELTINIKENNKSCFSYSLIFTKEFIHLFTIGKRFKILKNNSFLLQTFLSLNQETTKVKVYNLSNTTNIDSKQAINMILLLNDKENDILQKLRKNFVIFSLNNEDDIKYRFCYPEKNILDEIKEMKEIPYHIIVNVGNENEKDCSQFDLLSEVSVNICVKKYKEKKVKLMVKIKDNNNWSVIGKNKIIEEFGKEKSEKIIKIVLLPLVDGFLQLPEIEFSECELESDFNLDLGLDSGNKKDNNEDNANANEFEPIEYGTVIEGVKNVIKIAALKEYNLKINLT